MVLFPPYALLLLNHLSGASDQISLVYDDVAKNVGIVSAPYFEFFHLTDRPIFIVSGYPPGGWSGHQGSS
jgi:hypothetical protein